MAEVTKTPTAREAFIMPDACPAGPVGTIPVGGLLRQKTLFTLVCTLPIFAALSC